ncbi:Uncharacterized protein FWK35_00034279, partial [Aphis craccivora]
PPKCYKCQIYECTSNYCNHTSHCAKCGVDHFSKIYNKNKSSPAKYALLRSHFQLQRISKVQSHPQAPYNIY